MVLAKDWVLDLMDKIETDESLCLDGIHSKELRCKIAALKKQTKMYDWPLRSASITEDWELASVTPYFKRDPWVGLLEITDLLA